MNTTAPPPPKVERSEKEIITGLQRTVSASRLGLFLSCRLKFYFRYVLEIQKQKTPALQIGSAVHSALKAWNKARWLEKPLTLIQLYDAFAAAWSDESEGKVDWEHNEEQEEAKTVGWKLIQAYTRECGIPVDQKPDAVEVPVDADLHKFGLPKLVGILDLVQQKQIIDYKTASSTPNAEKLPHTHEIQTTTYAVLYREATGSKETGIQLHHLVKTKSPKIIFSRLPPMTMHQQNRLFHLMEAYQEGLERKDFVPSPGLGCMSCEFFNECRNWK
jgi:CRISPR/Cas system-associated exonuclease Cas4 (RecB family)